jgi:hypothetical protein
MKQIKVIISKLARGEKLPISKELQSRLDAADRAIRGERRLSWRQLNRRASETKDAA